jgi:ferredoxin
MKAEVDKSLCIGCGACASACEQCFELGDDGKAHAKDGCKADCCDLGEVSDNCPVQAITVK